MVFTWNFTVTHQDQTRASALLDFDAPGVGRAVTIPSVGFSCGHFHTLVGTQSNSGKASGSGFNSVVPPNDPGSQGFPKGKDPGGDPIPSWEGSPTNFEVDGADGGDQPADGGER